MGAATRPAADNRLIGLRFDHLRDRHQRATQRLRTGGSFLALHMMEKMSFDPPDSPRVVHQGDLFWIDPDASRGSVPGYPHPHLVLQDDVFNRSRIDTVIVCALSTNMKRANEPGNVLLDQGEGNLPKLSVVIVSQLSSVNKSQLGEYIGALSRERVEQVLAGLRFQQASFF